MPTAPVISVSLPSAQDQFERLVSKCVVGRTIIHFIGNETSQLPQHGEELYAFYQGYCSDEGVCISLTKKGEHIGIYFKDVKKIEIASPDDVITRINELVSATKH